MRRWMYMLWCVLACATPVACVEPEAFRCDVNEDCVSEHGAGRCEPTKYCSYEDVRCDSSRRYSELAGPYANACVMGDGVASSIGDPEDTANEDDDGVSSDDSVGDDSSGDDAAGEDSGGTDDGDAPLPAGGTLVWSLLGGSDRFLAVTLSDDRIIAAGQQQSDLSFVAISPLNGGIVASMSHNVGGSDDAVHSIVRGAGGEFVACGRNDDAVLGRNAWIGTVDASLTGPPFIASFWGDHACHVVVELDADRMMAAGEGVPIIPGQDFAWMYAFDRSNPTLGTEHQNEGEGSVWNAAAHVDGGLMFGGRLVPSMQSGKGVVADLGAGDIPSQFPVFSDALFAVHALAEDPGGFVLGGFESTDGAPAAWISAHEKDGGERWSWRPGHAEWPASGIEDVAVDGQGFAVAVGYVSDGSDQQRWIVRLDPQGMPVYSYALPNEMTGGFDIANAVAILPGDDFVVVGEAEVAPGEMDGWVARFTIGEP